MQQNKQNLIRGLAFLVLLFFAGRAWAQKINLTTWSVDDGMPQTQVRSMIQDSKGFLWICTFSGVAHFNGQTWKSFGRDNGLPRNEATAVYQDTGGRIYVGMEKGGLAVFRDNKFHVEHDFPILRSATVLDILMDQRQTLWVGTNEGLIRVRDGQAKTITAAEGFAGRICYVLRQQDDGRILAGTDQGLVVSDGETFSLVASGNFKLRVRDLLVDDQERLFAATDQGLWLVEGASMTPYSVAGNRLDYNILTMAGGHDGSMWLGTTNSGVVGIRNDTVFVLNDRNGLPDNKVLSLVYDREDNLWIGTDSNLARYQPGPFMVITTEEGLPNNFVRAMFEDSRGGLWFGTRNGMGYKPKGLPIQSIPQFDGARIYGISEDSGGRILAATREHGLWIWNGDTVRKFSVEQGLPSVQVLTVFSDSNGRNWVSAKGLVLWNDPVVEPFPPDHVLEDIKVLQIVEDGDGLLWLATNKGLIRLNPETRDAHVFEELSGITVWAIDMDEQGRIWAGTNGSGIFVYDRGSFRRIHTGTGLTNDYVWQILCIADGVVWAGHNLGLDQIKGGAIVNYNLSHGLADNEASATACWDDGEYLWFGTAAGMTRYKADDHIQRRVPPAIYMEAVEVNNQSVDVNHLDYFPRHRNRFEFFYTGVWLSGRLKFRYYLEGFDENWSQLTGNTSVKYLNLGPGDYRFRVQALNDYGVWSETSADYSFSIAPAWFEVLWIRILMALAVLALIRIWFQLRTRRMERNKIELEKIIERKTRALRETNRELENTQEQLVSAAHGAGMAETAIRILHNVGNALNSVNVSLSVIEQHARKPREVNMLDNLLELLRPHRHNVDAFLRNDARGRQIPDAFFKLLEIMRDTRDKISCEVEAMQNQVVHITAIMKEQESYVEFGNLLEAADANLLVADALRIEQERIEQNNIKIKANYGEIPKVAVARVKLVMVLINIIRNATEALAVSRGRSHIWVETEEAENGVLISIRDNGCGVNPNDKERIFFNGYTTKENHPGFGLHFCANSMTEMGGRIRAHSEGPGTGTLITLWLPKHTSR